MRNSVFIQNSALSTRFRDKTKDFVLENKLKYTKAEGKTLDTLLSPRLNPNDYFTNEGYLVPKPKDYKFSNLSIS